MCFYNTGTAENNNCNCNQLDKCLYPIVKNRFCFIEGYPAFKEEVIFTSEFFNFHFFIGERFYNADASQTILYLSVYVGNPFFVLS